MRFSSISDLKAHRRAIRRARLNSPVKLGDWFAVNINDKPKEYIQMCQERLFEKGYVFATGNHKSQQVRFDRKKRSIFIYPIIGEIVFDESPVYNDYIEVTLVDLYTDKIPDSYDK